MLYRLTFAKTSEGLLRVTASVGRFSEYIVAIYQDDEAFLHLSQHAGLDPEVVATLEREVVLAFGSTQTPTYCEELELIDDQLRFLRLGEARRLQALGCPPD
jgi:hypothetical protein